MKIKKYLVIKIKSAIKAGKEYSASAIQDYEVPKDKQWWLDV